MIEVLTSKLRSFNARELINKTILKISKLNIKNICGITAVLYGILFLGLIAVLDLDIGYDVVVNNKSYGVVASKKAGEAAISEAFLEAENKTCNNAGVYLCIGKKDRMLEKQLVKNEIIYDLDGLVFGYGILVDGNAVAALENEAEANGLVEELLMSYKTENNSVSFVNQVEVAATRVRESLLMTREEAAVVLTGCKDEPITHVVMKGETFSEIAETYKISSQELMDNNNGIVPEKLQIGQSLNVTAPVPLISVRTTEQITVMEKVPYQIVEQKDANMYQGIRKVIKNGVLGEKSVIYNVTKINNRVSEKTKIDEAFVSYATDEVVAVGTKAKPKKSATGSFIRPYYGVITSRYGSRWGRNHNGIDYGGSVGDPVKAADGGTVSFAGWNNGGYGYMIKINHGNGKETLYAHLSKVGVKVGQKIGQGEVIGKLGNTGRSTGPHLHFEIRVNGSPVNPSGYVK